jgi:hypothetical protein
MSSHSSLFVERGIATMKQVEEALARQVLYGDDLATNLLELLGPEQEEALTSALAAFYNLHPVSSGPLPPTTDDARQLLPSDTAIRHGFYPLYVEGQTLYLAVSQPLSPQSEDDLAFALGVTLVQLGAPQIRIREALHRDHGININRRTQRLIGKLSKDSATATQAAPPIIVQAPPPPRATTSPSMKPVFARTQESPSPFAARARAEAEAEAEPEAEPVHTNTPETTSTKPAPAPTPPANALVAQAAPATGRRRRIGPFTLVQANEELLECQHPNQALRIFFDFSQQFFNYSALFLVRGELALGEDAFGQGASSQKVRGFGIPLDIPSCLAAAKQRMVPVLIPLARDGLDATIAADLERSPSGNVLVLPIVLRNRCTGLLYADDGESSVEFSQVGEVVGMAGLVSGVLERILLQKKMAQANQNPVQAPATQVAIRSTPLSSAEHPAGPEVLARVFGNLPSTFSSAPPPPLNTGKGKRLSEDPPPTVLSRGSEPPAAPASEEPDSQQPTLKNTSGLPPEAIPTPTTDLHPSNDGSEIDEPNPYQQVRSKTGLEKTRPFRSEELSRVAKERWISEEENTPSNFRTTMVSEPYHGKSTTSEDGTADDSSDSLKRQPLPPDIEFAEVSGDDDLVRSLMSELGEQHEWGDENSTYGLDSDRPPSSKVESHPPMKPPHRQQVTILPSIIVELGDEQQKICDRLCSETETLDAVLGEVFRQGPSIVPALLTRLPGPMHVSNDELVTGKIRAQAAGPVLAALVALRRTSLPFVVVQSANIDKISRFYSTYLLGELPYAEAASALLPRLFDDDIEVRKIGIAAARHLAEFRAISQPLLQGLEQIALSAKEREPRRLTALEALRELRSPSSVPTLVQVGTTLQGELGEAAQRALELVTVQKFGRDIDAWKQWWSTNSRKLRVEWLIASLTHQEESLAKLAARELYLHNPNTKLARFSKLNADERVSLQEDCRNWWLDEGRQLMLARMQQQVR